MHTWSKVGCCLVAAVCGTFSGVAGENLPNPSDYIQDGLIAMWDGEDNQGTGIHDATATDWVDLTGKHAPMKFDTAPIVGEKFYDVSKGGGCVKSCVDIANAVNAKHATIEIVCDVRTLVDGGTLFSLLDGAGTDVGARMIWVMSGTATNTRGVLGAVDYLTNGSTPPYPAFDQTCNEVRSYSFKLGSAQCNVYRDGRATSCSKVIGNNGTVTSGNASTACFSIGQRFSQKGVGSFIADMNVYSVRVYDRLLTDEEFRLNAMVDFKRFGIGNSTLNVCGDPNAFGEATPAYGLNVGCIAGQTIEARAPRAVADMSAGVKATCVGYKLYDALGMCVGQGAGNAFTYTHPTPAAYRELVWQWRVDPVMFGENLVQNGGFEDSWITANSGNYGKNDGTQAKIASWGGSTDVRVAKTSCKSGYVIKDGEGVGNYLAILYWKNLSLEQDVEIPEDGEYAFSMRYVHRTDAPNATPRVSLKVTVGDVEVVPAFTVANTTPKVLTVTCSLKQGTQTLKIISPTPDSGSSAVYIDEVSLRQAIPSEAYFLVDGNPARGGHPSPGYGYHANPSAGTTINAMMPEVASVVDDVTCQCVGWRLYTHDKMNSCWKLRSEGAGRSCSVQSNGGIMRLEWIWTRPTSTLCDWVGDEYQGEWQVCTFGENLVQNGGFEDSWITANSGNYGKNDGTQAKIASWGGSTDVRVAKTSCKSGYVIKDGEGVGNYLAILYWKNLSLEQDVEIPEDGEYEFSMRYVHRTDASNATPRVSLKVTVGDVEVVPAFTVANTTPKVLTVTCSLKQGTQTLKIISPTPDSGSSSVYIDEVSLRQEALAKPTGPCIEVLTNCYDDVKGNLRYEYWIPWAGGDEDAVDVSILSRHDTRTDWRERKLGWQSVGALLFGTMSVDRGVWHYLAKGTNLCGTAYSPETLVVSTHKKKGLILLLCGAPKTSKQEPVVGPSLDPPEHGCLSECVKEKMTHTASPVYVDGRLYTLYQAGETHTVEAVWDPTERMRMTVVDWTCPPSMPKVYEPGVSGENFGAFVQTTERPPCSQTMIGKDKNLYLFFRGRPAEEPTKSLWCYRLFDTVRQKLADGAVICTLDGEEFNGATAAAAYNRLSGESRDAGGIGNECNIRLFSDGWYYTTPCICGDKVALIVRSKNLKDWESVAVTPNLDKGSTMEHDTAELAPGKWISAWRQEELGCVYSAVYDVQSQTWSQPQKVPDSIAVKPYLFRYKGVNYLAANISGTVTTGGYKAVRATLAIFSIGPDGSLTKVKTIVNPTGCHYVQTFEDGLGRLYLVYSIDERKLDATQCRSNIAFDLLEL